MSDEKSPAAKKEEEILQYWKDNNIFAKTLAKDSPEGEFVFYEGPPTANGRPGIHHMESRAFKDAIPRFRTMQGYNVKRKAGWDTHGLPVELEVEKELGIEHKDEIIEYGVDAFNNKCKENVWKYIDEWEEFTRRMAYWVDLDDPYITYEPDYMESVWNRLAQADEADLLYQDYKVVPWCPRCETPLSSHELAQGYKNVKDLTVTAKFALLGGPEEITGGADTYLLSWTTTPWTLPANIALAVGEEIEYVAVAAEGDRFIIAKELADQVLSAVFDEVPEPVVEFTGDKLAGLSYEPVYPFAKDKLSDDAYADTRKNAFTIYPADFVTTEDGTGIVHIAPMYGQDDFELGEEVGLPRVHLVDHAGHFTDGTDFLAGRFVHKEDVAVDIIKDLYHRDVAGETGLLFSKAKHEHEYPHCWRCKTPLVYYARESWYIRMTELREELLAENEKINWEPDHIKDGRFGEWLDGVKDWAISRERFWGTPLPIWQSEDGEDRVVIDSMAALKEKTQSSNAFFVMRHGEAEHNLTGEINFSQERENPLTDTGRQQAREAAQDLAGNDVDLIFTSPLQRTQETSEVIAGELGLDEEKIIEDERLREFCPGEEFEGKDWEEDFNSVYSLEEQFSEAQEGGETRLDIKRRAGDFLYKVNEEYEDKNILIVSHNGTLNMLAAAAEGADLEGSIARVHENKFIGNVGECKQLDFAPLPHNEDFELDLHRPYVDDITFEVDGKIFTRVPEVMDVWFDSGSMPFAQNHYPFENQEYVDGPGYPADFISEAIDQTRGWFYTLHAIGVLSGQGHAAKNIISLGHILDAEGNKMSKSVGNTVNPWEAMGKFGADAIRFWMYSINQPGESKNFSEDTVDEIIKKVFNLLRNTVRFYNMYGGDEVEVDRDPYDSPEVLDQWILSQLDTLTTEVTTALEDYDLLTPTRAIREFVGDLSQWYIRRSRDRFRSGDSEDKVWALTVTKHVLETTTKLLAPFTPFIAEELYQDISGEKESVHLEDWPEVRGAPDKNLLEQMQEVRAAASLAHDLRSQAHLKVRQPLATLTLASEALKGNDDLLDILQDEVNVQEITFDDSLTEPQLDTNLTDELKRAGAFRELLRNVQKLRGQHELDPEAAITLTIETNESGQELVEDNRDELESVATVTEVKYKTVTDGVEVSEHDFEFQVAIT